MKFFVSFQLLKDKQLLFIIGALLIVDSVIVSVWVFIDPMYRTVLNFTQEVRIICFASGFD